MAIQISRSGIDFIKSYEQLRLTAYDAGENDGILTIGYGHRDATLKPGDTITAAYAETLLKNDLQKFTNAVNSAINTDIKQHQFDALVSFAFNVGVGIFTANSSKYDLILVDAINSHDFATAYYDWALYRKSGGVVLDGLVARRNDEIELFVSADYERDYDYHDRTVTGPLTTKGEVYVHDKNRTFAYFDAETYSIARTGTLDRQLTDVAFGPDGQLFGIDYQSLYRVDPDTGGTTYIRRLPVSDANGLDTRDSDTAVITTLGGRWIEFNTQTGVTEFTTTLPDNLRSAGDVTAYIPDTSSFPRAWVVAATGGAFARFDYDAPNSGTRSTQRHALPDFLGLASPDGEKVIFGGAGSRLYAIDADSAVGHLVADLRDDGFGEIWGASWVVKPPAVPVVPTSTFEPLEYIASYPDLIAAFRVNAAAGWNHYLLVGKNEGRIVTFDALDYIASYADLMAAFGPNVAAGATHYILAGQNEGRTVSFDGLEYIASYGDLIKAFAANADAGATHFIAAGHTEGRHVTFDGLEYIASYPDLLQAFHTQVAANPNPDIGTNHYILSGYFENRVADQFDAARYLANYADLRTAFGTNTEAATIHFITAGYFEERTA